MIRQHIKHNPQSQVRLICIVLVCCIILETLTPVIQVVQAGEKGRDIIIYNGKVILKGGKKKGNIIISNGQGSYKYKKKYSDYGGYWK